MQQATVGVGDIGGRLGQAYQAITTSERLYDDIDAEEGRSNIDIEKHLRRAEVKASQAWSWVAIAQALGTQGDRYGATRG